MEITKIEKNALEAVIVEVQQDEIRSLNELQLALVGGGIGSVEFG